MSRQPSTNSITQPIWNHKTHPTNGTGSHMGQPHSTQTQRINRRLYHRKASPLWKKLLACFDIIPWQWLHNFGRPEQTCRDPIKGHRANLQQFSVAFQLRRQPPNISHQIQTKQDDSASFTVTHHNCQWPRCTGEQEAINISATTVRIPRKNDKFHGFGRRGRN